MPFESAKCPSCGASLNIDPTMEFCYCASCGNKINTKTAINEYRIEIRGDVSVRGVSTVANDLARGNNCLEANDWDKAFDVFSMAVDKQTDNFDAWYGLLKAITHQFTQHMLNDIKINGEKGLISVIRNCEKFLPPNVKKEFNQQINSLLEVWEAAYLRVNTLLRRDRIIMLLCCILPLLLCIYAYYLLFTTQGDTLLFLVVAYILLFIITGIFARRKQADVKELKTIYRDFCEALPKVRQVIKSYAK